MASIVEPYSMVSRHTSENEDFTLYPDPPHSAVMPQSAIDMNMQADAFANYPRTSHEVLANNMAFVDPSLYSEQNYMFNRSSPGMYPDDGEMRVPSSNLSTASAPSAASSAVGSPQSNPGQIGPLGEWTPHGLGVNPGIVGQNDYFAPGTEYTTTFPGQGMDELAHYSTPDFNPKAGFVGELPSVSTSCRFSRHQDSISSAKSGESVQTIVPDAAQQMLESPISTTSSSRKSSLAFTSPTHTSFSSPPFTSPLPSQQWSSPSPKPRVTPFFSQSSGHFVPPLGSSYPSLIHHPDMTRPMMFDPSFQQPAYPNSPSLSSHSPQPNAHRNGSQSPFVHPYQYSPFPTPGVDARRPSMYVGASPGDNWSGDETKEKSRCTYPDCGKVFKDLKAHMLTHQNERPEKCPIQTCDYHIKGFARKYDKNRHTLTHYKGTMVCGFCPGSGSAAEKSFNRADVFKRHLTAVHGVEQTPPNSRKKTSGSVNSAKKLGGYPPDATGKCSTCSQTFSNAQDFYEHLDDCVLRIVQQEDPAEAINAKRLAEVENDKNVAQTLEKNNLPTTTQTNPTEDDEEDEDEEMADETDEDDNQTSSKSGASPAKRKGNPPNGVQKSRGMTHSRGGVGLPTKNRGRKNRRDYPSSWGFDKGQMTMKKRVMTVFDGPRRLAKDDMMLSTDHEVRLKLADGKSYITDLDVLTLRRAEGFLDATDEEKGPWISDDPTEDDLKKMQEILAAR